MYLNQLPINIKAHNKKLNMKNTLTYFQNKRLGLLMLLTLIAFQSNAQQLDSANNYPTNQTLGSLPQCAYPGLTNLTSTGSYNSIITIIPDLPVLSTINAFSGRATTDYFDGLGRPLQTVAHHAQDGKDIVMAHVYDSMGREQYQYLPFAAGTGGTTPDGELKLDVNTEQRGFYDNLGHDEQPYSQTVYENSPLSRVIKGMQPGKSWVGSGRGVTYEYRPNTYYWVYNTLNAHNLTGGFPRWSITSDANALPTFAGYYGDGELSLTIATDEDGKSSIEAKDKRGLVVMKLQSVSVSYLGQHRPMDYAYTFYVYDDLGNVRCVMPPMATTRALTEPWGSISWAFTLDQMNGYCYTYLYDEHNRVVEKKIPGKEIEYFVYDKRDRLVMRQDAAMRHFNPSGDNSWQFNFYDALDRPTVSAICVGNASRTTMQTWINDNSVWPAPHWLYYFKNYDLMHVYPASITSCTILNYNYYDDYSNTAASGLNFDASQFSSFTAPSTGSAVVPALSTMTRGLATGSKSLVLDPDNNTTATWLTAVSYYDDKGRVIQSQTQNINGGIDISSNIYYFQGELYKSIIQHQNPLAQPIAGTTDGPFTTMNLYTTLTRNFGTNGGNGGNDLVKTITQKINFGIEYPFADYSYDHLGRPVVKQFAACNILNEYNIRGFLNHIDVQNTNNNATTANPDPQLFEEHLFYDFGFHNKFYNGNIAGITWQMSGSTSPWQSYGYSYDSLNRLTYAEYRRSDDGSSNWVKDQYDYTTSNIAYDLNGNIKAMHQRGVDPMTSSTPIDMDALGYVYAPNSNQLIKVEDTVAATQTPSLPDFKNNADLVTEYTYDGDLLSDANKGIGSITYNFLHKPSIVTVPNEGEIHYWYDESGNRLRKTVHYLDGSGNPDEKWDYIGNFVYKNDTLQYILNDEGRARPVPEYVDENHTVTKFIYDYFVKDHLGNVRSTITATPINPSYLAAYEISQASVEQLVFDNIANVRDLKPGSIDPHDVMAARLNGNDPKSRVGTAILLQAIKGDRFQVSADAYYEGDFVQSDNIRGDDIVAALSSALMGGTNYSGVPVSELSQNSKTVETIFRNPNLAGQIVNVTTANDNPEAPRAHLNYLFFDDKMNLVSDASGGTQVFINSSTAPGFVHLGEVTCNTCTGQSLVAPQNGYVLVYIDNQSIGKDVWFDNLMIGHYTGEVLEENHYYPFGLCLNIDQSNLVPANTKKYQSIELEKHFGLETYETLYRGLDPQIGRLMQIDPMAEKRYNMSPFVAMSNNPVSNIDPLGNTDYTASSVVNGNFKNFDTKQDAMVLDGPVITPEKTNDLNVQQAAAQDVGRNDAVRAKTNAGINGLYGTLAAGAAAPLAVVIGLESTPAVVASYLSNPVAWNEFGATTILGAAGYEGGAPGAGTMEGAVTEEGSSTIYRAMSTAEVDDVAKYGFRMNAGGYETGKLFAPTLNEATQFGKYNFGLDGIPNTIMKVQVPNNVLNGATKFGADGMNAISIPASQLNLLKGTPLNYSPLN